jgi:DNA-binding MarR family transcriptional regulator
MSSPLALSLEAYVQTSRLRRLLFQRMASALEAADLTAAQWLVLSLLRGRPDATLTEISDAIDYDPSGLSRAIYALRERHLVNARPAQDDRRSIVLSVSESGRSLQSKVESVLAGKIDAQLDTSLGRRDLERMLDLIARATGALSAPLSDAAA